MPRPCKIRRVCAQPGCSRFGPRDCKAEMRQTVTMTLDEYESIRLIDMEGMTQAQCAKQMGVARTTAQSIYNNARSKLARCLVQGAELAIEGGDYVMCDGSHKSCMGSCECCRRVKYQMGGNKNE